jgi:hypothetical protein
VGDDGAGLGCLARVGLIAEVDGLVDAEQEADRVTR